MPPRDPFGERAALAELLRALQIEGYFILQLKPEESRMVHAVHQQSRAFFSHRDAYKLRYKFYPTPGGYLTPTPGAVELFEFRRGLRDCPPELNEGMRAFELLERIALRILHVIHADLEALPG